VIRATLLSAILAVAAGGCDWRTFDDLSDEAWAEASGSPEQLNAGEWGTNVAYGGGSSGAVTFLASGQRPDGVGSINYDASGNLSGGGETIAGGGGATTPDPLAVRPPLVGDPANSDGMVALGIGENGAASGRVLLYQPAGPSLATAIPVGSDQVHALAFGTASSDDAAKDGLRDLVVVTGNQLTLISGYTLGSSERLQQTCTVVRDRGFAAAVAELDSSSDEEEIVLSMGNANQDGAASSVMFLAGTTISAADADTDTSCIAGTRTALGELTAPGDEPDFGAALVVADFDGGNGLDLAVGAPASNSVYVYMNIDLSGGLPGTPITISGPSGSSAFGTTLAAGDFDGDGSDELVIGDPQATAEGVSNAGRAYIVPQDGDFATQYELGDADPESDQNFGRGLAVGSFGGTGAVLAVAAKGEVFTYFRTQLSADVRQ
jgi:hypothetical protein